MDILLTVWESLTHTVKEDAESARRNFEQVLIDPKFKQLTNKKSGPDVAE